MFPDIPDFPHTSHIAMAHLLTVRKGLSRIEGVGPALPCPSVASGWAAAPRRVDFGHKHSIRDEDAARKTLSVHLLSGLPI